MGSLKGLTVLLTRPLDQAEETAALIRQEGGTALVCPGLVLGPPPDAAPLMAALKELPSFDLVVFTSVNAVRAVAEQVGPRLAGALAGATVAAVGERTAAALEQLGVTAAIVAREPTAEGLFADLRAALPALRSKRVLLPRASEGREALPERLAQAGAEVHAVVAYQMTAAPPALLSPARAALARGEVDLLPLGSPRTAAALLAALAPDGPALLARVAVGAIGETTATSLQRAGVRVDAVSPGASFAELLQALARIARQKQG